MDKRGAEELLMIVGYVVIVLTVYTALSFWMNNTVNGQAIKDQATTKQVALLIDSATPGSQFKIYKNVSIEGSKVKSGLSTYEFFTNYKVSSIPIEGGIEVNIG